MHHAVQIETQAKEQGLTHLHTEAAVGDASRELGLDRREYALHQSGAPVAPIRKRPQHLASHCVHAQASLGAPGRDRGLRSELWLNVGAIPLAVIPRTASCGLRQRELLIQNLPRSPPFSQT